MGRFCAVVHKGGVIKAWHLGQLAKLDIYKSDRGTIYFAVDKTGNYATGDFMTGARNNFLDPNIAKYKGFRREWRDEEGEKLMEEIGVITNAKGR